MTVVIRLKRRFPGSYSIIIDGERYAVVNDPRYQRAETPRWEVRKGGHGAYDIGATSVAMVWTLADARDVLERIALGM